MTQGKGESPVVRAAAAADVPALAIVAERSYRHAFRSILEPAVLAARDAGFFAARFATAWPTLRVADAGGRVIGFAQVTDRHIDMLFVDPLWIGTGAGRRLLAWVEAEGARSLECFRDNQTARDFYERHGWRLTAAYERDFAGAPRAFVRYERAPAP